MKVREPYGARMLRAEARAESALRRLYGSATVQPMPEDPRMDTILSALAQLTTVVGSLAESVAQIADNGSGPAASGAGSMDVSHIKFSTDHGYADLVPLGPDNVERRTRLANDLGILGDPAGAELIQWGARGFYRKLDKDEGQDRIEMRRDLATRLVQDAQDEDVREAQDMGRDLLAVWDPTDEADFIAPAVLLAD